MKQGKKSRFLLNLNLWLQPSYSEVLMAKSNKKERNCSSGNCNWLWWSGGVGYCYIMEAEKNLFQGISESEGIPNG